MSIETALPTFMDWLAENGYVTDGDYKCARCNGVHPTFAFVRVMDADGNPTDEFQCSNCHISDAAVVKRAEDAADLIARVAADPWDCQLGGDIKHRRNLMIESIKWAADPVTSPFVETKRLEFVAYIRSLNRITVDFCCPSDIEWPAVPTYGRDDYA